MKLIVFDLFPLVSALKISEFRDIISRDSRIFYSERSSHLTLNGQGNSIIASAFGGWGGGGGVKGY